MRSFRSDQEEAKKYSVHNPLCLISMTLSTPSKCYPRYYEAYWILNMHVNSLEDLDYPGFPAYNWDGTNTRDLFLPMVLVSAKSAFILQDYVAKYDNITVRITSEGTLQVWATHRSENLK